jgi:hypothetical protein
MRATCKLNEKGAALGNTTVFASRRLQMKQSKSRRRFFVHMGQMIGLAAIAPALFGSKVFAEERRRARPAEGGAAPAAGGGGDLALPMVEPGKGAATAVNYHLKHADVKDAAVKVERSGVPFEKQFCTGCGFYTKVGNKDGGEVGKCQIFPNQLVKGSAWCASWNKKA